MTAMEPVTDPIAHHAEGPVWSSRWGLRWVDMLAGDVLQLGADGSVSRRHVDDVAALARPRAAGGWVVVGERRLHLADSDDLDADLAPGPEVFSDTGVRLNEGGCDPDGNLYAGSMAYDAGPGRGTFYRVDRDGRWQPVLDRVTISNGFEFSPDDTLAYYVDTPTGGVDVFDWSSSTGLRNRRRLIDVDPDDGAPDGLTVDAEGHIWVALFGGAAVRRYSPDGALDDVLELPARQVTAVTFGGADLDEVYVTTSRENLGDDAEPLAGALFRADVGVRGLPVRPYAG